MSVPGGEERVKGSSSVVVVLVDEAIVVVDDVRRAVRYRRGVRRDGEKMRANMSGTYTL
jgi:hypothetical protein